MCAGTFINFLLPFKEGGVGVSAEEQAKTILRKCRDLITNGSKGVGILYSANYGQTQKIGETYQRGDWFTGTNGANQAAVMHQMESLLSSDRWKDLQGKLRIVPITTMDSNRGDPTRWNTQRHMTIVKTDLERIRSYLEDGWDILGWQNQDTVKNHDHPYAIGGGITSVPAGISIEIQTTLIEYAKCFRKK